MESDALAGSDLAARRAARVSRPRPWLENSIRSFTPSADVSALKAARASRARRWHVNSTCKSSPLGTRAADAAHNVTRICSSGSAETPPASLSFAELPAELRTQIYQSYFDSTNPRLKARFWPSKLPSGYWTIHHTSQPCLLLTCRMIYIEALPIMASRITVETHLIGILHNPMWRTPTSRFWLPRISNVFSTDRVDYSRPLCGKDALRLMKALPSVREFELSTKPDLYVRYLADDAPRWRELHGPVPQTMKVTVGRNSYTRSTYHDRSSWLDLRSCIKKAVFRRRDTVLDMVLTHKDKTGKAFETTVDTGTWLVTSKHFI